MSEQLPFDFPLLNQIDAQNARQKISKQEAAAASRAERKRRLNLEDKHPPKKWKWIRRLIVACLIMMGIYFAATIIARVALLEVLLSMTPKTRLSGVNVLVFGVDETQNIQRADTIIVAHLDTTGDKIGILSIPRDTRVNVSGHGFTKINHAYAYGDVFLLKQSIEEFLSIPIHYYVKIELSGVEELINRFNGITIDVEKELKYEDKAGELTIDLKKGTQTLDGKQALGFLRFRHDDEGDIGRIRRQQDFLRAFAKKIVGNGGLTDATKLVSVIRKSIETDMPTDKMLGLSSQLIDGFNHGTIRIGSIPGETVYLNGQYFWRPVLRDTEKMIDETLLGLDKHDKVIKQEVISEDKSAQKDNRRKIETQEAQRIDKQTESDSMAALIASGKTLKIEVLNGFGVGGAGQDAAALLTARGVIITKVDNAANFNYTHTKIVDWKGQLDKSLIVAKELGIDPSHIIVYDRPEKSIDITLVLGHNWDKIKPKQ